MATNPTLTLALATNNVRADLMDTDSANQRWSDALIQRALDRANERYSQLAPLLSASQLATVAGSRLYASPASAGYRIDTVEFPLGRWPKRFQSFRERLSPTMASITLPPSAADAGAGPILAGTYYYFISGYVPGSTGPGSGEYFPTDGHGNFMLASITIAANRQILLSDIPTGPYGTAGRRIYRTQANLTTYYYLASLADNDTTAYLDTTPDSALSSTGKPVSNTSGGIPQFEIDLPDGSLPADGTGTIEVTYQQKHQLDANGTTIPERHWDALYLGAAYFCLLAYVTGTNDNLDYVDGQFRDRVNDSGAPAAWLAQAKTLQARWDARLAEIRTEVSTVTEVARWGDVPRWWDRL